MIDVTVDPIPASAALAIGNLDDVVYTLANYRCMLGTSRRASTDSIKAQGVVQPIVVRPIAGGRYEILAGERRWRAAQLAGLHKLSCLVRYDLEDSSAAAISLIENVQRMNLNAMEQAEALNRLVEEFGFDHGEVAEMIGVKRATVTNRLRSLKLNPTAQKLIREGRLNEGHGKVLAGITGPEQDRLAIMASDCNYSVRQN